MAEYWLISAPGDKTPQQTYTNLKGKMTGLSPVFQLQLPELKVGTLDTLVGLSDDLGKLDGFVESVTRKLAHYMADVLEEHQDRVRENLLANGQDLSNFVTKFQWDSAKYPIKQSLRNLTEIISKQVTQIEHDLKTKASAYNTIRGTLASLERKATGSLLTRNLGDLVKKEDFVLDSEYLTTQLVVVPRVLYSEWQKMYWKLTDMVVPESSRLVFEDNEHGLYTVTLFKKVVDEFKVHARDKKFLVREFVYDEQALEAGKNEITKLESDKKKQFGPLVRWLRVNFSDSFIAWIHVKALRVFVESVLRYGLPVNFQAMLLQPSKKSHKKIKDMLDLCYQHLDNQGFSSTMYDAHNLDIPGLSLSQQEYYPCFGDKTKMVGLMFLLVVFVTPSVPQQCSKPVRSIKGKYLSGHVLLNGRANGLGDCLINCSFNPRCKSINFRFEDLLCELNEADRYTHPWDYGSKEGHAYSDYPFKETFKEFYMTPLWLDTHASYIDSSSVITVDQITFNGGSMREALLLRIPLVEAGLLEDGTPLSVEITVANDVSIGQSSDSDPRYGVSDGTNFIGFKTVDQGNYGGSHFYYPCHGLQATSGQALTDKKVFDQRSPTQVAKFYPDQFVFIFKLDKSWGSCFTAHGFIKTVNYTKRLLLSKGVFLEVYKMHKKEKVGIKYMEVTVRKTGDY